MDILIKKEIVMSVTDKVIEEIKRLAEELQMPPSAYSAKAKSKNSCKKSSCKVKK